MQERMYCETISNLPKDMFFCEEKRATLVEECFKPATAKELGLMWKEFTDQEKQKYETMAKEDKQRYVSIST